MQGRAGVAGIVRGCLVATRDGNLASRNNSFQRLRGNRNASELWFGYYTVLVGI